MVEPRTMFTIHRERRSAIRSQFHIYFEMTDTPCGIISYSCIRNHSRTRTHIQQPPTYIFPIFRGIKIPESLNGLPAHSCHSPEVNFKHLACILFWRALYFTQSGNASVVQYNVDTAIMGYRLGKNICDLRVGSRGSGKVQGEDQKIGGPGGWEIGLNHGEGFRNIWRTVSGYCDVTLFEDDFCDFKTDP